MTSFALSPVRLGTLAAFKTVVETGSMNQAANLLFVSQSALSQQIRTLETTLGVELLRRTTKGIEPTAEGRVFYSYCGRVLDESVALERQIRSRADAQREVWVGAETVLGENLLPEALSSFGARYPDVRLRLVVDHTHEILDAVRQGRLHLGVVPEQEDDPLLTWTHLLDQSLVVICHPSHPLAANDAAEWRDLLQYSYVAREPWTRCRQVNARALASQHLVHDDLDVVAEMKTFAGKKAAVMANVGFSIAPWCGVRREVGDGCLVCMPLGDVELSYPVYLVERATVAPGGPLALLREFLRAYDWTKPPVSP
ncbi:MAG: LysR family transcriptional regulator [Thermoleophilia bacterium]